MTHEFEHQVTGRAPGNSNYPAYDALPLGLPDYWYPILFSRTLGKRPVRVTVCGEELVLVRGQDGRPRALLDRCAHRGIPLSRGCVEFPGTVTCAYHGWTYDVDSGELVAVLTDGPDSPIARTEGVRVPTYPVAERAGLVWVYPGAGEPPPLADALPEDLAADDVLVLGRITEQRGDWRHAAEAGFDEGHAKYLHRRSIWKLFRYLPAWTSLEVRREQGSRWLSRVVTSRHFSGDYPVVGRWPPPRPFWKRPEGAGAKNAASVSIALPGVLRIEFRSRWFGNYVGWEFWIPSTVGNYRYVQLVSRPGDGLRGRAFALWYWLYCRWVYHEKFNGQDTEMIQLMRTPPERLYRPDQSIVKWRRMCEQAARDAQPQP